MSTKENQSCPFGGNSDRPSSLHLSRRHFLWTAAGVAATGKLLYAQESAVIPAPPTLTTATGSNGGKSAVALATGASRRQNICQALTAIEDQILPVLKTKKYVILKPNIVNTMNQLASTHVDALHGILDFLAPRYKGPVIVAESSAGYTTEGYDHFGYFQLAKDHKPLQVNYVDLNEEGKYGTHQILNGDLHFVPVRLAARFLDPEAYIICSAVMKTHNTVVATLSIKNMCLGAPLHSGPKETARWNDKRIYHGGVRQTHVDITLTAQKLRPFWGAAVIDGHEGMEGDGPNDGTLVPSRVAIASTDYLAADRVAVETMGIDSSWLGYLNFCAQSGLGQVDLVKIDLRGVKIAEVARKYKLHAHIERALKWMGPMNEVPEKMGQGPKPYRTFMA